MLVQFQPAAPFPLARRSFNRRTRGLNRRQELKRAGLIHGSNPSPGRRTPCSGSLFSSGAAGLDAPGRHGRRLEPQPRQHEAGSPGDARHGRAAPDLVAPCLHRLPHHGRQHPRLRPDVRHVPFERAALLQAARLQPGHVGARRQGRAGPPWLRQLLVRQLQGRRRPALGLAHVPGAAALWQPLPGPARPAGRAAGDVQLHRLPAPLRGDARVAAGALPRRGPTAAAYRAITDETQADIIARGKSPDVEALRSPSRCASRRSSRWPRSAPHASSPRGRSTCPRPSAPARSPCTCWNDGFCSWQFLAGAITTGALYPVHRVVGSATAPKKAE